MSARMREDTAFLRSAGLALSIVDLSLITTCMTGFLQTKGDKERIEEESVMSEGSVHKGIMGFLWLYDAAMEAIRR